MAKMPLEHFTLIYRQLVLIRPELQRLPDLDEIAPRSKMRARSHSGSLPWKRCHQKRWLVTDARG